MSNRPDRVLKSPDIPSILVETAFISNPSEERRLTDEDYQMKLGNAILAASNATSRRTRTVQTEVCAERLSAVSVMALLPSTLR